MIDTEPKIRSETALAAAKTKSLSDKVEKNLKVLDEIKSSIKSVTSALSSEFQSKNADYDSLVSNVDSLKKKLADSKESSEKLNIKRKISTLSSKRKELAGQLKQLATKSKYHKLVSLKRQHKNLVKLIRDTRKNYHKSLQKEKTLHDELRKANHELMIKYNLPKIQESLKNSDGLTTLYRADLEDPTVFKLVETSPSETVSNETATKPIDGHSAETNFVSQNGREYSATYYLKGKNFKDLDSQYRKLYEWSYRYEFVVNGFSHWNHALITSLEKSIDNGSAKNGMVLTITFNYARQAQIKYKRKKTAVKHKAPAKKHKGNYSSSKRYIKVKSGMTYSQIARKTGVSLHTIMKMNRWPATKIPIGAKVRYK